MKLILRSAALITMAFGLAACGGGGDDDEYVVKGRFIQADGVTPGGVLYEGMTLKNGPDTLQIKADPKTGAFPTTFEFPTRLGYGDVYQVSIGSQPKQQACTILSPNLEGPGRDVAGRLTDIDVVINCKVLTHDVIVKVTNPVEGVLVTNGSTGGNMRLTKTTTELRFAVQYKQSYGISIVPEAGKTPSGCRVENGTGIMDETDIDTVKIICPAPAA